MIRAVIAGLALVLHALASAQPIELQDDRGKLVRLPGPPQRVVSILPSLTETVCELQQCQRLVGVDRYSNWPAAVQGLPRVGGGIDPSIEAIVALRPDLVLVATSSRGSERLEALGLKVLALEPRTHADVQRVMRKVAVALGQPESQAREVWRHIDAAVSAAAQSIPLQARGASVYFEVSRAPHAAGESSFIGETLARLGARNVVPASLGPFPKLNPEFVVRANPEVILVGQHNADGLTSRPGWSRMGAVAQQRMCVFAPAQSDVIVRPGPRMAEAARLLAQCLTDKSPSRAGPAR